MKSRLDFLDNFEGVGFTVRVTVGTDTEMDLAVTGIFLESNVGAENRIRRSHFDVLDLSMKTVGTFEDSANVIQLIHILIIMTSFLAKNT